MIQEGRGRRQSKADLSLELLSKPGCKHGSRFRAHISGDADVSSRDGNDPAGPPVQCFGTFTGELYPLSEWLKHCRVDTVAMEATGVYWIPVYQILETSGFELCLVNARYFQNVPGRKTDVSDCQWLQRL